MGRSSRTTNGTTTNIMSCCTPVSANARDPSNTKGLRVDLLKEIRRRSTALKTRIRQKIGYENDALHLMEDAPGGLLTSNEKDRFEFTTRQELIRKFVRWLRARINDEILEPATTQEVRGGEHWLARYIRPAAGRGYKTATGRLMQKGVSVENRDLAVVFNLPVHRRQLQQLYTRAYGNLTDITDDLADEIRDELTQGLADGDNPRDMARRLNERVSTIQKTRAETLARTEIIHSHTQEAITRYRDAGDDIGLRHTGRMTARDLDVCAFCRRTSDAVYTLDEFQSTVVLFRGQTYRLAPPSHPNGRCSPVPEIGVDAGSLSPLSERVPGRVVA